MKLRAENIFDFINGDGSMWLDILFQFWNLLSNPERE